MVSPEVDTGVVSARVVVFNDVCSSTVVTWKVEGALVVAWEDRLSVVLL